MRACCVEPSELGRYEDLADLVEEAHVRLQYDAAMWLLQRTDVVEHCHGGCFAGGNPTPQVEPRIQQTMYARVRAAHAERVGRKRVASGDAVEEARDGEVFLFLEVVGDAGRDETDAARYAGERHPLHAMVIEDVAGRGDDGLFLLRVPRSGSRRVAAVR